LKGALKVRHINVNHSALSELHADRPRTSDPRRPILCAQPNCGAEMNQHATKIDYRGETPELQEVHTCPGCGRTELRQAE
jgi:hypothetical protein